MVASNYAQVIASEIVWSSYQGKLSYQLL